MPTVTGGLSGGYSNLVGMDGYDGLAAAVVWMAYYDLKKDLPRLAWLDYDIQKLERKPLENLSEAKREAIKSKLRSKNAKLISVRTMVNNTLKFIGSDWYHVLCDIDPKAIIERLTKEVDEENAEKGRKKKASRKEIARQNEKIHEIIRLGFQPERDN